MNELKIEFSNESYAYFKTDANTASDAFDHFYYVCGNVGIDISNMIVTEVVLRDEDYNEIDEMEV